VAGAGEPGLAIQKGPYLQNVTQNSIAIMWETTRPSDSRVEYGLTSEHTDSAYDATPTTLHEVSLSALQPDTLYHYQVSSATETETVSSKDNTFETAIPGAAPFRFAVYGDTRSQPEQHSAVVNAIVASAPRIILHTGDFVSDGRVDSSWQSEFFDPAQPLIENTTLFPCLGNHEWNADLYYRCFDPPQGGGDYHEQWYSFDYANCHLTVIDSNADYKPGSQQYSWLVDDLQSADNEWCFVIQHHPAYSSGPHGGLQEIQDHLVPLYESNHVDMVFSGHDHLYERSYKNGVYYIVTGGGGAPLYTPDQNPNPYQQYAEKTYHHCTIEVMGTALTLRAHHTDGSVFDSVVISHGPAPPAADFSASPRRGTAPLLVQFTDLSMNNPTSWSWIFGDGSGLTAQNPSHEYTSAGTYAVSLTVTNASGSDTERKSDYIIVTFPDVLLDHWACEEIQACLRAGVVAGYGDGCYHPDWPLARDHMAVYISRALAGDDEIPAGPRTPSFLDVPRGYWAYDHIEYAKACGVVLGYFEGLFLPNLTLTRAQMAVFVARAIADPTGEEGLANYRPADAPTFTDIPPDYWCYRHIEYLAENQVVSGYPDGSYQPAATVTRDQMAVYIARAFDLPL
jgi:PKD repeat protein